MTTETEAAPIGHNNPPPYSADELAKMMAQAKERSSVAGVWIDKGKLESEDDAGQCADVVQGIKSLIKDCDAQRKADKQPHADAAAAVDKAWKGVIGPLDVMVKQLGEIVTAYAIEKQREAEAKRLADIRAAQAEQMRIEEEARAAKLRGDAFAQAEAAQQAKEVAKTIKKVAAAKSTGAIGSASGAGRTTSLRTFNEVEVTSMKLAFIHLLDLYPEELKALIERLAMAEYVKTKKPIPGTKIHSTQRAV